MTVVAPTTNFEPTAYQARVLELPETVDLALLGGRGSGKTLALLFLALRFAEQHAGAARVLIIRQSYKGLADIENRARFIVAALWGRAATYNGHEHLWRLPNGATIELGQLDGVADYSKYQGREFGLILIDEAGEYSAPELLDLLRSNLRAPASVPTRFCISGNPGGAGHSWIFERHVAGRTPWTPYETRGGATFVTAPGTLAENPHLGDDYKRNLKVATEHDRQLRKAWIEGDWHVVRGGAYFAHVLGEDNAVNWPRDHAFWSGYRREGWRFELAVDHGSAAPAVALIVATSPGDFGADERFYAPRSLIVIDEVATHEPGSLNRGMNYTVPRFCEEIVAMCKRWDIAPVGIADDAIFADHGHRAGTLAHEYRRAGVRLRPARKGDRVAGWERMRTMFSNAGKPDVPGLYLDRRCVYSWKTLPTLQRDPRRPEDIDTRGPDHAADAARYACGKPERRGGGAVRIPV